MIATTSPSPVATDRCVVCGLRSDACRSRNAASARGESPEQVELRVLRGGALIALDRLGAGEGIRLPGGGSLEVLEIVKWGRFIGRRDISTPLLYAGFACTLLGALLMFTVIRLESQVSWKPVENGVILEVALRPQRFAPLFAPQFEGLVARSRAELEALRHEGSA